MRWERIRPAEGRRMPWKQGGGSTLELAVEPPGASLGRGFQWRVSSAEVGESGPFSAFPGLERWLLLLEGDGFELDVGPLGRQLLCEPLHSVQFSGDWPAWATLVGGPCRDFNVIWDPRTQRVQGTAGRLATSVSCPLDAPTLLLFVAAGSLSVPTLGLDLGQGHLLKLQEGEGLLTLAAGLAGASLVTVRIWPRA